MGIKTVRLRIFDGVEKLLQQVRYIFELKRNLISPGFLEVIKRYSTLMKRVTKNGLQTLMERTVIGDASPIIGSKFRYGKIMVF